MSNVNDAALTRADLIEVLADYPTRAELKAELKAEVAQLATKAELKAEVAQLATKAELAELAAKVATKAESSEIARLSASCDVRFDGLAAAMHAGFTEMRRDMVSMKTDLERTIKGAFEKFRSDFRVLDDQSKAIDDRVTSVRGDLDAHTADTTRHRR